MCTDLRVLLARDLRASVVEGWPALHRLTCEINKILRRR